MNRCVFIPLCVLFLSVGPASANDEGASFPTRFAWGRIKATNETVELHVHSMPRSRVISIPPFNNPYRRVYLKSDAEKSQLEFQAEVKQWLITVPKSVGKTPVIVIETVGAPQLLTRAIIHKANDHGTYVLPAHQAVVHGEKLRYEPQPHKNTIGFWHVEQDWCEWKLDVSNPGEYEVHLLQGCGKGHGGSAVEITLGDSGIVFTVEDTGHFQNFKSRRLGTLTIQRKGKQSLQIRPRRKAKAAVMDIRSVTLIPISPTARSSNESSEPTITLARLHKIPLGYQGVDIRHVLYHKQGFQAAPEGQIQLEVLDMRPDHETGSLWFWAGTAANCFVEYNPATGQTNLHALPQSATSAQRLPPHLYLIPKQGRLCLIDLRDPASHMAIYDSDTRRLSFAPLLTDSAEEVSIVTGNAPQRGNYLYLFVGADAADTEGQRKGLIRWNTVTSQGEFIAYPYSGPGPIFGVESPDGRALWCPIWNGNALARFDIQTAKWTGFWPTPLEPETQPTSGGQLGERLYCVDLFQPRLLPFDTSARKWLTPLTVPGHGTTFGVLGGGWTYRGKLFCSMATLKGYIPHGGPIGVDGKPWHFLNRRLCYDPASGSFCHWILEDSASAYWMNSVAVLRGPHVYFVAIDLAQADGTVDQFGKGDVAVFQTHPRGKPELAPVMSVQARIIK